MWSSTLGIMTATPAPVVAAPAPVVEYIQPATFQTATAMMTVTGVDMNRIGIPDVLQQPQAAANYLYEREEQEARERRTKYWQKYIRFCVRRAECQRLPVPGSLLCAFLLLGSPRTLAFPRL